MPPGGRSGGRPGRQLVASPRVRGRSHGRARSCQRGREASRGGSSVAEGEARPASGHVERRSPPIGVRARCCWPVGTSSPGGNSIRHSPEHRGQQRERSRDVGRRGRAEPASARPEPDSSSRWRRSSSSERRRHCGRWSEQVSAEAAEPAGLLGSLGSRARSDGRAGSSSRRRSLGGEIQREPKGRSQSRERERDATSRVRCERRGPKAPRRFSFGIGNSSDPIRLRMWLGDTRPADNNRDRSRSGDRDQKRSDQRPPKDKGKTWDKKGKAKGKGKR